MPTLLFQGTKARLSGSRRPLTHANPTNACTVRALCQPPDTFRTLYNNILHSTLSVCQCLLETRVVRRNSAFATCDHLVTVLHHRRQCCPSILMHTCNVLTTDKRHRHTCQCTLIFNIHSIRRSPVYVYLMHALPACIDCELCLSDFSRVRACVVVRYGTFSPIASLFGICRVGANDKRLIVNGL